MDYSTSKMCGRVKQGRKGSKDGYVLLSYDMHKGRYIIGEC